MTILAGVDIGGTTSGISLGETAGKDVSVLMKSEFETPESPHATLDRLVGNLEQLIDDTTEHPEAIGVSCGGPLDSNLGLILSPPNLPGWDEIDVLSPFEERFDVPAALQNDANAGALAEWKWGAANGYDNVIFLTFGTGMGAGLILDGSLYIGTNDMAGEVGHIRLAEDGPVGYGKPGSFEGFCSGGGIARLARNRAETHLKTGDPPAFCLSREELPDITAKKVGLAAQDGDELAREIYRDVGERLGQGLAILVDALNPELIVVGSIYGRQQSILEPAAHEILEVEAIERSRNVCDVVPAGLGEQVGDFASLAVAMNELGEQ